MKEKRNEWWWAWGLVSLLASVGCSSDKATQISDAPMTPIDLALGSSPTVAAPMPMSMPEQPKTHTGYFVSNENIQPVFFDLSKSQLNETAQATLKKNAEWLKTNPPVLVQIAGTADTRGSFKRNQTLAERRASKVRDFYVMEGIPEDRLIVVSLGTETPTCTEVSEDCLSKSRRVETLIESKPIVSR
jgi:peptidoglycan-associated lipoprotein